MKFIKYENNLFNLDKVKSIAEWECLKPPVTIITFVDGNVSKLTGRGFYSRIVKWIKHGCHTNMLDLDINDQDEELEEERIFSTFKENE